MPRSRFPSDQKIYRKKSDLEKKIDGVIQKLDELPTDDPEYFEATEGIEHMRSLLENVQKHLPWYESLKELEEKKEI